MCLLRTVDGAALYYTLNTRLVVEASSKDWLSQLDEVNVFGVDVE